MKAASAVVRRISDGSLWAPAGDSPYPLLGFNFVPAAPKGNQWVKDMDGLRWITCDARTFNIIWTRQ